MSVDREFRIRITTSADTTGGKQTAASLEEVKKAIEKSADASTEAGKAEEKHATHLHALHKVFHALNEVVPGLGVAMQAAFSPIGATISLAVMVLGAFREHMQKLNEEFKRMEEEAARPLTNRLEAMRDSVVRNAVGMGELHARLADAASGQRSLAQEVESVTAAFRDQKAGAEALEEAQKTLEMSGLEEAHAAGLLSDEQYFEQKLAIEQAYVEKKRELEERQEMTEILIRRRAIERAQMEQPGLTTAAETAEGKKEKALEDLGSLRPRTEIDEDKKKTGAALKAFEDKYAQWSRWFEDFGVSAKPSDVSAKLGTRENLSAFQASGGFHGMVGGPGLSEAYEEWVRLKTGADAANAAWKQAPGEEARRKVAADAASREADKAARKAEENEKFAADAARDLEERRRRLGDRHEVNQELNQTERGANKSKVEAEALKSPTGKLLRDVSDAESILQHGGQISVRQNAEIKTAAEIMTRAHITNVDALIKGLGTLTGDVHALNQRITSAVQRIDQQSKQMRNLASP